MLSVHGMGKRTRRSGLSGDNRVRRKPVVHQETKAAVHVHVQDGRNRSKFRIQVANADAYANAAIVLRAELLSQWPHHLHAPLPKCTAARQATQSRSAILSQEFEAVALQQ